MGDAPELIRAIIAFPATQRRAFIRRFAAWLYFDAPGTGHLPERMEIERGRMVAAGVSVADAESEVASLEVAIRCEVTRLRLGFGWRGAS